MKKSKELIAYLRSDAQHVTNQANSLIKAVNGVRWKLEEEPKRLDTKEKSEGKEYKYEYDLMISYSHKDKDIIYKIYENLTQEKFKVWIDKEEMYDSIFDRMADAVENSEFIIICSSSHYEKSKMCKTEAVYAKSLDRKLIPLRLDPDHEPSGWLGLLTAGIMYVNFSKVPFEEAYTSLLGQIKQHHNQSRKIDNAGSSEQKPTAPEKVDNNPSLIDRATSPDFKYTMAYTQSEKIPSTDRSTSPMYSTRSVSTSTSFELHSTTGSRNSSTMCTLQ